MARKLSPDMKVLRQLGRALEALEMLQPHERRAVQNWLLARVGSDLRRSS